MLAGFAFAGSVAPHGQAFYPPCPLYSLTGVYCPGCGATRAVHALATGHLATAVHDNILLVAAVPVVAVLWALWLARALGRIESRRTPVPRRWVKALVVGVVAFGVLRNLPGAPFTWLAPLT